MRLLPILLAILTLFAAAPLRAESLTEYREHVDRAVGLLERAEAQAGLARASLAREAMTLLGTPKTIQLQVGAEIRADNSHLRRLLEAEPPDVSTALAHVRALQGELARESGPGERISPQASRQLAEILGREEFKPRPKSILDRVGEALGRIIEEAILRLGYLLSGVTGGDVGVAQWALRAGIVAVVAAMAVWVLSHLATRLVPEAERAPPSDAEGAWQNAGALLARAQALAQEGDYREAMRYLYLSTMAYLDEKDVLPFRPSLTNRENLELARSREPLWQTLQPMVAAFDLTWYGHAACRPEDYRTFEELSQRAREVATRA